MNPAERVDKFNGLILDITLGIITFFTSPALELSIKEQFLLELLGRRESATMSELAAALSTPLTTMTSIVTRLVRKGYLQRHRIEEDRRVVVVALSPQGKDLVERHRQEHLESAVRMLSLLTEEEQDQLLRLGAKILKAIPR